MQLFRTIRPVLAAALIVLGGSSLALAQDNSALFAQAMADSQMTDDYEAADRALEGFGKLCDAGVIKACANAGVIAQNRFGSEIAIGWMQKACDGGKLTACYHVADRVMYSDTPDQPKARALFGKACAQGVTPACLRFGSMLEGGEGGPEDFRKAFDVYKRACAAPSGVACERLTNFYRYRDGFQVDEAISRATLEVACGLNAWSACSDLAQMMRAGQGGPVDEARATELFEKVCLHGDNTGACDSMVLTLDK